MTFGAIFLLASGLAMDAAAVSAARGLATPTIRFRHVVRVSLFFGGFQAIMPLLGWFLGRRLGPLVEAWDHWIAFGLLSGIGAKMLWEARSGPDTGGNEQPDPYALRVMLLLALATSIDAFAAGVMLPMLDAPLALSMLTIGLTTAGFSVIALFAGRHFGSLLGKRLDAVGGFVLIGLGVKILIEHLSAA